MYIHSGGGWLIIVVGCIVFCGIFYGLHKFSVWLFNEKG
jgi:hypothetical protein